MRTNVTNSAKCKLARFFSFFSFFPHQSIGLRFPVIEPEYFTALLSKARIVSVSDTLLLYIEGPDAYQLPTCYLPVRF